MLPGTSFYLGIAHCNARRLLEDVKAGRRDLQFIEVMTCPGGCINGGGQPRTASPDAVRARMQALYAIDRDAALRSKVVALMRFRRTFAFEFGTG